MKSRLLIAGVASFAAAFGVLTAASTASAATVTLTNPDPIIIPDQVVPETGNLVNFFSVIDGSGTGLTNITDVDVVLHGFNHDAAQSLVILVGNTNASGAQAVLTDDPDDSVFNGLAWSDNTVRFSDGGGALTYGVDGTYAPVTPLAALNDSNALLGDWFLVIVYDALVTNPPAGAPPLLPGGVISDGWSLILTGTPVPVPGAAVMFMSGLAGVAGLRLRKRKKAQA